ncbi:MAG: tRNA (adenosine(37)-N6)-dimethylallyltransferase MiaA [Parcubacteria group bacterium]|jgi:tRNA dimethylallyltransferase
MESRSSFAGKVGNNKIIVILGPTSSGKSSVAIKLAQKFNGEIISVDSRQIYRGMDIGTGKVTKAEQALAKHHMLDVVGPKTNFSAAQFKKYAEKIIADILKRGKVPILCGGTGFWIKALVDDVIYPEVKPDWKLREELGKKSAEQLFVMLKKLDPVRARNIDAKNPVRLIRAIEICKTLGKVPLPIRNNETNANLRTNSQIRNFVDSDKFACLPVGKADSHRFHDFLQIGISLPKKKLHKNIEKRLKQRFGEGMIEEVERLHSEQKISWKKMESFGLGYLWIAKFLQKQLPKEELFSKVYFSEKDYAKRQMTWFGKDERIIWLEKYSEIEKKVEKFIRVIPAKAGIQAPQA